MAGEGQEGAVITFERRALQASVTLAALVPVTAGCAGLIVGAPHDSAAFDSHYRYMSGLLLGLGLLFWTLIPKIETRGPMFRALTFVVFVGGLARLFAYAQRGDPGVMRFALVMELVVTPALCLWQARVARAAARAAPDGA